MKQKKHSSVQVLGTQYEYIECIGCSTAIPGYLQPVLILQMGKLPGEPR